jgi:hypothetical protein
MMLVMGAHNQCAEHERLRGVCEDALTVWEQVRHANVRSIDRGKLTTEHAAKLRDQALFSRNIAANELYVHSRTCPTCILARK